MILRLIFYIFLFYLGYKLLFEFIIPLFKTTRQVKRGFRNMQEQMRNQSGVPGETPKSPSGSKGPQEKETKDYIDFEEIK